MEAESTNVYQSSLIIRLLAKGVSYLLHPLLIVTYMLMLLMLVNPYLFGVNSIGEQLSQLLILRIFLSTFLIPMVAMVMLRFLGLVESLEMRDKQERIAPYVVTGIFYLWMVMNFVNNPQVPTAYTSFVLGATIALFLAFFINIFSKISAHTVGMGSLLGMVVITMLLFSYDTFTIYGFFGELLQLNMITVLLACIFLCGLVGTARMIVQGHDPRDVYGGFLVGFTAQFIALRFLF